MFTFSSGLTGEGDRMATLTILEILGGYITNFYTLVAKLKIGDNFGRVYIYIYIYIYIHKNNVVLIW